MDIGLLTRKLTTFAAARLALAEIGELTLQHAMWLIDANADGMFEALEAQGRWDAIEKLEEVRADLRAGVKHQFGELPPDACLRRAEVEDALVRIQGAIANVVDLRHRQVRGMVRDVVDV